MKWKKDDVVSVAQNEMPSPVSQVRIETDRKEPEPVIEKKKGGFNMIKWMKSNVDGVMDTLDDDGFIKTFIKDLKNLKSALNWLTWALYVFICLKVIYTPDVAPTTINTIIITTGGMVTGIFTNFVWAKNKNGNDTPVPTPNPNPVPTPVIRGEQK